MSYKSEAAAKKKAMIQFEALEWAYAVCRDPDEDDPASIVKNMLDSIFKDGRPKDFPKIIEERRRGLK